MVVVSCLPVYRIAYLWFSIALATYFVFLHVSSLWFHQPLGLNIAVQICHLSYMRLLWFCFQMNVLMFMNKDVNSVVLLIEVTAKIIAIPQDW